MACILSPQADRAGVTTGRSAQLQLPRAFALVAVLRESGVCTAGGVREPGVGVAGGVREAR
jgi:hypothetical protein